MHSKFTCLQQGPIYFLVPRKCGLCGVCCEGIPKQVNFLIDEAHLISKGSNVMVSYLHYFFEHFGLGQTIAELHCDNCSGQNKNRYVLWYLAWRVAIGLHQSITLNFLVAGRTQQIRPRRVLGFSSGHSCTMQCHHCQSLSLSSVKESKLLSWLAGWL